MRNFCADATTKKLPKYSVFLPLDKNDLKPFRCGVKLTKKTQLVVNKKCRQSHWMRDSVRVYEWTQIESSFTFQNVVNE